MTSEIAIKVENLSKCYQIYDRPQDRLLQMLVRGRKQYFKDFQQHRHSGRDCRNPDYKDVFIPCPPWCKDLSFKIKQGKTVSLIKRIGSVKSTLLQMICGTLNPPAAASNEWSEYRLVDSKRQSELRK